MQAANKRARRCWELSFSRRFFYNLNLISAKALASISGTLIKWLSLPHRSDAVTLINPPLCPGNKLLDRHYQFYRCMDVRDNLGFLFYLDRCALLFQHYTAFPLATATGILQAYYEILLWRPFYSVCISGWLRSFRSLRENAQVLQSSPSI